MKKIIIRTAVTAFVLYAAICALLYFCQEKVIFHPQKLSKEHKFSFDTKFEEINTKTQDGSLLNGLLFKADTSHGLIFYLHGNAGCIDGWGNVADLYVNLGYDVFFPDYRGFGKSEGSINNEKQLYSDMQLLYDEMKKKYSEQDIIVLGYSIGTGPAAQLASVNNPGLLILQAPYFSLTHLMETNFPVIPTFLLNYKFETAEHLKSCKMPVVIFHGTDDMVISYSESLQLEKQFKPGDRLIALKDCGHNGMTDDPGYIAELANVLN